MISVQLNSRVCFAHNHIRIATAWEVIPIDEIFRKPTLDEYKKLGIESGVMVCGKENIGAAKRIQNNGGILGNEIDVDGVVEQRYWVDLV